MRYAALDGWRGACALLVAIYHFNTNTAFSLSPIIRNSFLFVEFFFLLSGFVICHAYSDKLRNGNSLWRYLLQRLARLWPLHIVLLCCMIPMAIGERWMLGGHESERFAMDAFWANVFLVQALGLFDGETWNIVSWSISVELYTCLLFGAITLFTRSLWVYAGLSLIAGTVLYNVPGSFYDTYHFAWFRGVYGFFLGCFLYRLYEFARLNGADQKSRVMFSIMELASLAAVVVFLSWVPPFGPYYLAPLVFSLAVWVFAFDRGVISQLFQWHWLQRLGLYSYSIYLVHGVWVALIKGGLTVAEKLLGWDVLLVQDDIRIIDFGAQWLNLLATLVYVATLCLMAAYTYRWIEKPAQDWMREKLKPKAQAAEAV